MRARAHTRTHKHTHTHRGARAVIGTFCHTFFLLPSAFCCYYCCCYRRRGGEGEERSHLQEHNCLYPVPWCGILTTLSLFHTYTYHHRRRHHHRRRLRCCCCSSCYTNTDDRQTHKCVVDSSDDDDGFPHELLLLRHPHLERRVDVGMCVLRNITDSCEVLDLVFVNWLLNLLYNKHYLKCQVCK